MSIAKKYGAHYFSGKSPEINHSRGTDLYSYTAYSGKHLITVESGDSLIYVDGAVALWVTGETEIMSDIFAVKLRGYQCGDKSCSLTESVNLPYVNGCATRQIFPPERIGDPTFQQLTIPPFTSEQMHHIHPTPRVVLVLEGSGFSIVGQTGYAEETELLPGMMCVLDPMSPHHFRTESEFLVVLPVHVFSSTPPALEQNHPMFNGTREV